MGIKFKFHPLFVIYVFLCIYFGWFNKIFYYVVVVTLHEFGHFFMAKHYGYKMDTIIFNLNGAGLTGDSHFKPRHEIVISLAGPIVNVILSLITICLFWIFPTSYLFTYDFLIANIVVFIFNLIPIYPLDGGRIMLSSLVLKNKDKNKLLKLNKKMCLILGIVFLGLFVHSLFFIINYNLLITSCFLTLNYITCDKNKYFDKIVALNKNTNIATEIKIFKFQTYDKNMMLNKLSPHYYSLFVVGNGSQKKTIEENELINM